MQWRIYLQRVFCGALVCFLIYIIVFRRRSQRVFLTESDIYEYTNEKYSNHKQLHRIPRIIHQTWKTTDVPVYWNATVESVRKSNAHRFKYLIWTDDDMHDFVRQEYPYLYRHTFLKYPLNIQRVDAFRYLVLYRMGGIYIDMDNGCRRSFDSLLDVLEAMDPEVNHTAAFPRTSPIGISNGFMITTKGHPLFKILVSRLPHFNRDFLVDYLTVMLSAGPLYLSVNEFYFNQISHQSIIRIIDENVYSSIYTWHTPGNSWHGRDARIILQIYHTWRRKPRVILYCFLLIITLIILGLLCFRRNKRCCNLRFSSTRKILLPRKFNYSKIKPVPI
ncbi:unnamed protein product [Rotaria socialis]|uniref:Glycosyltransferase n=1 Tax=Rotaria socialis TaxID=392032 RepID=A0A821RIW7_9BILA|nr:unnamed protein product [Rotaria socialis]CAF4839622.1 unnamed protein product [Rotaria socialis]